MNLKFVDPLSRGGIEEAFVLFEDGAELIAQDFEENPCEVPAFDEKAESYRHDPDDNGGEYKVEQPNGITDPVRLYLREMGATRLLNRDSETEVARRMERGLRRMRGTLARCPMIIQKIVDIARKVQSGVVPAREVLQCNDPLPGDEIWNVAADAFCAAADQIEVLGKRFLQMRQTLINLPRQTKPTQNRHLRWEMGRNAVKNFTYHVRHSLPEFGPEDAERDISLGGTPNWPRGAATRAQSARHRPRR